MAAREKNKKKGKPITEDDLRNHRSGGTVSQPNGASGSSTASPAPAPPARRRKATSAAAPKPPTEEEQFQEAQKAWQEKLTAAQSDVTNWTGEVARSSRPSTTTRARCTGPAARPRVDSLENAKRQLAAAQTTLETLQEEGRRNRYR